MTDVTRWRDTGYLDSTRYLSVELRATVSLDVPVERGESIEAFRGRVTELAYQAISCVDQAVVDIEDITSVSRSENHSDDGQCHPECWARAVAEHEAAEAARRERQS